MRRMIKRSRLPHAPFFQEWDEENEVGDCELPDPSNLVPTVASGTGWRGTSAAQKSRHTKTGSRLQTPRFLCSDEDYSCNPGWVPDGSNGCTVDFPRKNGHKVKSGTAPLTRTRFYQNVLGYW